MKRRRSLLSLLALLLLVGLPTGLLIRAYQREQAGHELILAIKTNDTRTALAALRNLADPNVRETKDGPLSFRAYLSMLWHQLRGNKLPPSQARLTALALAVQHNNAVVVEALLAAGARDNAETLLFSPDGFVYDPVPLLLVAAKNKNVAMVQALAKHGWNMNAVDLSLQTALFYAGDAATIKALVASGTRLDATDRQGWTALDARMLTSDTACFKALFDLGAHDANSLFFAIRRDDTRWVGMLLDLGWSVDAQDKATVAGETPLIEALDATQSGDNLHAFAVLLLLQRSAHVNDRDKLGRAPLHLAAAGGGEPEINSDSLTLVHILLERGANVNAQDKDGMTPLMIATLHLRPPLIQALLQQGAQVNLRTSAGETALSLALQNYYPHTHDGRHAIVVRLLKAAGAKEGNR